MTTEFSLDLRTARRKSGFTQRDLAHLLGARQGRVSDLELGRRVPTLPEIIRLSLIYGRSFESLFAALMEDARGMLRAQVATLHDDTRSYVGTFNRNGSLKRLRDRLAAPDDAYGSA